MVKDGVVLKRRIRLPSTNAEAVVVSINRPDQLNCFNTQVCHQLAQVFRELQNDDDNSLVAVIFTGEGTSFCAGADLSNPPNPLEASSDLEHDLVNNPVHQMRKLRVPLIAALKGYVSVLVCVAKVRYPPVQLTVQSRLSVLD